MVKTFPPRKIVIFIDLLIEHYEIFNIVVCVYIYINVLFCMGVQLINNVIVSGGQGRDSALHIHESILPQTPLPSRVPHNIGRSSICSIVGPCWLCILHLCIHLQLCVHVIPSNTVVYFIFIRYCLLIRLLFAQVSLSSAIL